MRLLKLCLALFAASAIAETSVWEVSDGERRLYIGGTMHLLSAADYPLPKAYGEAYRAAHTLVFEADVGQMSSPYWVGQMQNAIMLPAGQRLSDQLAPATWAAIEGYLATIGIPAASIQGLSPAGFVTVISVIALKNAGLEEIGIDSFYMEKAQAANKQTLFLEGIQEQLDFIAHMGEGQEDALILSTLDDISSIDELLQPMVDAWRDGDMQALDELGAAPMREDFPALYKMILVDRNRRWLPDLIALLATDPVEFVLVGALHLAGPDGVLRALQAQGYQVRQLP